ncbi:MAG: radical SAM protein [Spirochaetota bacterium]
MSRTAVALPPHRIEQLPGIPGPTHARVWFRAAHGRLTTTQRSEFARFLAEHAHLLGRPWPQVERTYRAADGTVKLRLRLADGATVESVVLDDRGRRTLCVSSQAGCAMGCVFCRTADLGLLRGLGADEILAQYYCAGDRFGPIGNVVFMGMGEPLQNVKQVFTAAAVLAHPLGPAIPFKRLTISTCGIPEGIDRLRAHEFLPEYPDSRPRLAVSLVTADPLLRARLMPGATRAASGGAPASPSGGATASRGADRPAAPAGTPTPLRPLVAFGALSEALARYLEETRRPLTLEMPLIADVTDGDEQAELLCKFLERLPRQDRIDINLIPYNPVPGLPYAAPSNEAVDIYARRLIDGGWTVTGRFPRGGSIGAGCGQLGEESPRSLHGHAACGARGGGR